MSDRELEDMIVTYETAPGTIAEVISYLINRRLKRLPIVIKQESKLDNTTNESNVESSRPRDAIE